MNILFLKVSVSIGPYILHYSHQITTKLYIFIYKIFNFPLNLLNIYSHNFTLYFLKQISKSYFNSHTFITKIFQIHHLFNFQYFTFYIFINKSINTSNIFPIFYTHIKNQSTNQIYKSQNIPYLIS